MIQRLQTSFIAAGESVSDFVDATPAPYASAGGPGAAVAAVAGSGRRMEAAVTGERARASRLGANLHPQT